MKQFDKTALLFEMLLGTDMQNVNRKIEAIRVSPEYVRVANFIPSASSTQSLADVRERFDAIDIYGILSVNKALVIEQEIKELDRRLSAFPSLNPYLADGSEKKYKLRRVGQIAVEINSEGMIVDDFVTNKGVTTSNRRKVIKSKLFNWYKEAKKGFLDHIENSKLMLSKIRNSKIGFGSINFQYYLLALSTIVFLGCLLFLPSLSSYRDGTMDSNLAVLHTLAFYVCLICAAVSAVIKAAYKTYPFRMASKMRKQVVKQRKLVDELASKSYYFEKVLWMPLKLPIVFKF